MRIDVIFEPDSSADTFCELGLLAESYGLGAVWTANIISSRDPFMCFSTLARQSSTIRMGPIAISPFELHPLKMANLLFALNEMSRGRANLIVGGGGGTSIGMGLKPHRRTMYPRMVRGVQECVEFLKQVSADKVLNFDGEVFQVHGYRPDWARDKPPHIYIGASGLQMLKMATKVAHGVMGSDIPIQLADHYVTSIHQGLAASGRSKEDFRISNLMPWHVKPDREAAIREARSKIWVRGMLDYRFISSFLNEEDCALVEARFDDFGKAYIQNSPVVEGVPDRIFNALVDNMTFTGGLGDVDELIEELRKFKQAGFTEFGLRLYGNPAASIQLIGERVAPALQ